MILLLVVVRQDAFRQVILERVEDFGRR